MLAQFLKRAYERRASPLGDGESRKRLIADSELGNGSPRDSEDTVLPAMGRQKRPHRSRTYAALAGSLAITNIVTLWFWISSMHRMNQWIMEDYYNRPAIEHLGQASVPVEYEMRRFHTGIVAGDVTDYFDRPGTKADVLWNKFLEGTKLCRAFPYIFLTNAYNISYTVGLTRLTSDQAGRLGEETSNEWNNTDSYVGVMGAFHQLHCLVSLMERELSMSWSLAYLPLLLSR